MKRRVTDNGGARWTGRSLRHAWRRARPGADDRGFALLIVVLTIAALLLLAAPFVVSMRLQERSSQYAVAGARGRYAVNAAYNHALAQLLRAADEYGDFRVSFDDLPPEYRWRPGRTSIQLAAAVEDEQGKLNINTAPRPVLRRLFADVLDMTYDEARGLAMDLEADRYHGGPFATLGALATRNVFTESRLNGQDPEQALDELRAHLTVHSAGTGSFSPVNINTCSIPVLRAVLAGVRLRHITPTTGEDNAGDGTLSLVEIHDSNVSGVWMVTCTNVEANPLTGSVTWTFDVSEAYLGESEFEEYEITLTEWPDRPAGSQFDVGPFTFTLTAGTTPFEVDDSFTFSADRFGYDRDEGDPSALDGLGRRLRAQVMSADPEAGEITLDDASGFPEAGWVQIDGDFIHYANREGDTLTHCTELSGVPARGDIVARVVPDMGALESILAEAVAADELSPDHRSAILASAKDPTADRLLDATTGLCFAPSGRYSIEAISTVSNPAGSVIDRRHIRRIVHLDHGTERTWTLDTQSDFDVHIAAHRRPGLITTPRPTYFAEVPPSELPGEAGVALAPVREPGPGWTFEGPTLAGAAQWNGAAGAPPPGIELDPEANLFRNGDRGLYAADGAAPFRTFATAADPDVGAGLRRIVLWVKPADTFDPDASSVFLDFAAEEADDHWNRIRVAYEHGSLVFRIADEAIEPRSAEVRADVQLESGVWHQVEALWAGMEHGRMALMLDGRLVGSYHPSGAEAEHTGLPGERWIARVANFLADADEAGVRDTKQSEIADPPPGPKTVYGYGTCRFLNEDESTRRAEFHRVHRGGSSLSHPLGTAWATRIDIPEQDPPKTEIGADEMTIPVEDASDFPPQGYIRINNEIIRYASRTATTIEVAPGGRGQDFGDNPATEFRSTAAEHEDGADVVCVSIPVGDNSGYPTPHHYDIPRDVEDWFGLEGLDTNTSFVHVGEEWISYTHRDESGFLVNVLADAAGRETEAGGTVRTSSMRAVLGSPLAAVSSGTDVLPVYRVTTGGRIGTGDRVTLLDDDARSHQCGEVVVGRAHARADGRTLVSFTEFIPTELSIYTWRAGRERNARLVKFPSGRYVQQRFAGIGSPVSGTGGPAESSIGSVQVFEHRRSNTTLRMRGTTNDNHATPVSDGIATTGPGADLVIGTLDPMFNTDDSTEWRWAHHTGMFGTGSWPLIGYLKLGDEALFYKVRWPHDIRYTEAHGAETGSPQITVTGPIPATGNITANQNPIDAGFNPHGGYLVVSSYTTTEHAGGTRELTTDEATLQWLIEQEHLTEEQIEDGTYDEETGTWTFAREIGPWTSTSYNREYVFYSEIRADYPTQGEYTFVCSDGRHLYDSHTDNEGNPLGHDDPADSPSPTLTGRTVALSILGRARLGTAASPHPTGSRVLPMANLPATVMPASPYDEDGQPTPAFQTDRIPVEDHAAFPDSGYLEVRDGGGNREIIYYTHKTQEPVPGSDPPRERFFFNGVRRFRGRFGTTPIDLTGLERFDDVRDTSDGQAAKYAAEQRRHIRLFRPRFEDRMPLAIPADESPGTPRTYAPHSDEDDLVFFQAKRTVRGATWKSISWTAETPPNTRIVVLARLGDSPDWERVTPVRWDAAGETEGRLIFKFDDPDEANTIDRTADTIEVRAFFKFEMGYDISTWQVPTLEGLTVTYRSAADVLQSEELAF